MLLLLIRLLTLPYTDNPCLLLSDTARDCSSPTGCIFPAEPCTKTTWNTSQTSSPPRLLHDPPRVYQSRDMRCMSSLLVGNQRSCILFVLPLILVPLFCLERCASAQKPPADTNRNLAVRGNRQLLSYSDLALALQRLPQSLCCLLASVGVGWPHVRQYRLLLPHQCLQPLLKRQHQPQIPHHQLAYLAR
jgi:hypothetical protein